MNFIGLYTFIQREVARIFRVIVQTLISPLISASLYIFIFGYVIGAKIDTIAGVPYISYVFPGILMLNIIGSSFTHTSSSVYFGRFMKSIEEVLIAPFAYGEIVLGFVLGGVARALLVGFGILGIGMLFGAVSMYSLPLFLLYVIGISTIFSLLGILVGLWAKGFEQLSMLNTFVITPLTYLGGIFYSISMLPPLAQTVTLFNPFFYFVNGIRGAMVGVHEASLMIGFGIMAGLITVLTSLTIYLFKTGYGIRA